MEHELKTWPEYFDRILDGTKTFELRKADRPFEVGDILYLREWSIDSWDYTGREIRVEVSYLLRGCDVLADDFVCMGLVNPRIAALEAELRTAKDGQRTAETKVTERTMAFQRVLVAVSEGPESIRKLIDKEYAEFATPRGEGAAPIPNKNPPV